MIVENKFEDPLEILKLFLMNMHLLTPEERHIIVSVIGELVIPRLTVQVNKKAPIERDFELNKK